MAAAVADSGYPDYRPTDAAIMRLLVRRGGAAISRIGEPLGVSRQAARKLVDGLEQRGYAYEARDEHDARSVKVALTPAGQAYAGAVIRAVHALNREVAERVGADDLVVADAVLRATITAEGLRTVAAHIASPTPGPGGRRGCETS
jgi:DNA-binding MarR family transcriptional regulator